MAERTGPEPPRLEPVELPELTEPEDTGDVRERQRYDDLDWSGADREFWTFTGCAFRRVNLDGTLLRGTHLNEVTMAGLDVPELVAPRSTWRRVDLTGGRIGSAEVYDTSWRSVSMSECKIGYLNARSAQWQDLRFADCTFGELDLSSARVTRLALDRCRIETLTLSGSRLTDVDLRGADFRAITGVAGLAGSWITEEQLTELAPHLATQLKISIGTRET
ncbi:MAG TPA: pentapeptide repeat-containing protein [Propionibacteriaceae bacterium]|nr:pentapeptide repeat-containing protein [Propionibacteriaceae bacterium]